MSGESQAEEILSRVATQLRAKRAAVIEHDGGSIAFSTGWAYPRGRSWNWVGLVDGGEFSHDRTGLRPSIRYVLFRTRIALVTIFILGLMATFTMRGEVWWARLLFAAGGWLCLIGVTHAIASLGVHMFLGRLVDEQKGSRATWDPPIA